MSVFPTIFSAQTTLAFALEKSDRISFTISTVEGKIISSSGSRLLNAGEYTIPLNFSEKNLAAGMYILRIANSSEAQTFRLIYQGQ
ncbi:MAG: T9SS type A sorting domain-containing protein [Bacteroidetes bacterium]|nr:T9SS type A sorting domain-containing protein [Bacteroidota bacterium]